MSDLWLWLVVALVVAGVWGMVIDVREAAFDERWAKFERSLVAAKVEGDVFIERMLDLHRAYERYFIAATLRSSWAAPRFTDITDA